MPSLERVRFVSSGTEAAMSAVRVARAATGRDEIIKFEGCYHGHADAFLVKAGSGALTLGTPTSPGVTRAAAADTLVATLQRSRLGASGSSTRIAARSPRSSSNRSPATWASSRRAGGFLAGLARDLHARRRAADFRRGHFGIPRGAGRRAGRRRRQARPDLPGQDHRRRAARRRLRRPGRSDGSVSPAGPVYQAGTLSGNPLAMTAGLVVPRQPDAEALQAPRGARHAGWPRALPTRRATLASRCRSTRSDRSSRRSSPIGRCATTQSATSADTDRYATFFRGMLARGVYPPPSQFEAWFLSSAHSTADIDKTIAAAREAMKEL